MQVPKWQCWIVLNAHVLQHHWTYPLEEFITLGAHGETSETGETDLIFIFFGLLLVALRAGVYTLGLPGGTGRGGGIDLDEPCCKWKRK